MHRSIPHAMALVAGVMFLRFLAPAAVSGDESLGDFVPAGFILGSSGRISAGADETIQGEHSVVGDYRGSNRYNCYLMTDSRVLKLEANHTYTVSFRYRVLSVPDSGFEVLFYSAQGGNAGQWLPSRTFTGGAGEQGEVSLTNTLGPYEDYQVRWNIVGTGAVAIDSVTVGEDGSAAPPFSSDFEEPDLVQGRLPFQITDTQVFQLGAEGQTYVLRSANVRDLNGDGTDEVVLTVTTYNDQLPEPIIILNAKTGITDMTSTLFPGGVPKVRHSPYTLFPDLDRNGRPDLVLAEAGLDHEPWTGARIVIALQNEDGTFRDVSSMIPEDLWNTRSYAIAVGDLNHDGIPEVLLPDQGDGRNTALLSWRNGTLHVERNWIAGELWGWPGKLHACNSLAIADLDQDRWPDLILGGGWERPNTQILFGQTGGFRRIAKLPDGAFGHTEWEEWDSTDETSAQGADVMGLIVADFDNDGRKDIFSIQEQVLLYKPGAITDRLDPNFQDFYEHGGQTYADTSLQVFMNKGHRKFDDASRTLPDRTLGRRYYLSLIPLDVNHDGFLDVVGGYWTKGYDDQIGGLYGTTLFLNDGTGVFQQVDGATLFPTLPDPHVRDPFQLGMFVPTRLASGRIEGLFVASSNRGGGGLLTVRRGISRGLIGTGPDLVNSAALGFPGYDEFYYLRTHSDASMAVRSGQYRNGLDHYRAVGIHRGYQAFAANATVHGSSAGDTLILAIPQQAARIQRIHGGWRLTDMSGKYGKLQLMGINTIRFLDGTRRLQ